MLKTYIKRRRLKNKIGKKIFSTVLAKREVQPVYWKGQICFGIDGIPLIPEEDLKRGISLAEANKIATDMYTEYKFYELTEGTRL